ncbi:hypothetical protein QYM36_011372 [Artemia franciscana]|uniref:Uncharacterized protein n=1 Tax=Artemia franciscana TaxID=6661 RepID=A0AA88L172_ARTSF|nr:hypothetical protein QYM36_011372 [Artemia franciscana]
MSKTGTCTPIHEIEDDVYRAQLLLRNDAPWSEDLADKTSYRYLRLKRNALRFLKVVFPDARTSVLGFAPSNRRQRDSTGSQVQMEIVLVSNITEYDAETVSTRLQAYQVDDEVTVSGIAFSVYTEVYANRIGSRHLSEQYLGIGSRHLSEQYLGISSRHLSEQYLGIGSRHLSERYLGIGLRHLSEQYLGIGSRHLSEKYLGIGSIHLSEQYLGIGSRHLSEQYLGIGSRHLSEQYLGIGSRHLSEQYLGIGSIHLSE